MICYRNLPNTSALFQVLPPNASRRAGEDIRLGADVVFTVQVPADQRTDHGRRAAGDPAAML